MTFPHRYTTVNHHFVRIMNNTVNDCFADGSITFISNAAVPSFGFKLCAKDYRPFCAAGFNDFQKFSGLIAGYRA